ARALYLRPIVILPEGFARRFAHLIVISSLPRNLFNNTAQNAVKNPKTATANKKQTIYRNSAQSREIFSKLFAPLSF
ncbi:MAG: hypothetical protein K2N30_00590, partial [Clostridia bacterium]|nr:hypothetical protein [Clostridia bacterium]